MTASGKKVVVEQTVVAHEELSAQQRTTIQTAASALYGADYTTFDSVVESIAKILGTSPTFHFWNVVSAAFQAAYIAGHDIHPESAARAWRRVADAMLERYALEKPASPTAPRASKARESAEARAAELRVLASQYPSSGAVLAAAAQHAAVAAEASQTGDRKAAARAEQEAAKLMAVAKILSSNAKLAASAKLKEEAARRALLKNDVLRLLTGLTADQLALVKKAIEDILEPGNKDEETDM